MLKLNLDSLALLLPSLIYTRPSSSWSLMCDCVAWLDVDDDGDELAFDGDDSMLGVHE